MEPTMTDAGMDMPRPMNTLEHADHVMRVAQGERAEHLDSTRGRVNELEKKLAVLEEERAQALHAWETAEENLRAELNGCRHFIEQAEQPDLALTKGTAVMGSSGVQASVRWSSPQC